MPEKIGKYRILERIGRGGMGTIYKAHDPILDRLVALKVISSEVEVTDELRARFFREAQACAKLNHPNIVTIYDLGEDDGSLFIVMELLEGQELRRFIAPGAALGLEDKLSVMVQVCGGLHFAHQKGIVHRDMKPSNIFLLANGRVKILDFGIAHMATTDVELTRTGSIMGTLRYISPEQVRGRVDHRSDMFSIGSVFYELLTLRPPFTGDDPIHVLEQLRDVDPPSPTDLDGSIPPKLTTIVQRAMRKNPADRFRDLDEMRFELELVHRAVNEERHRIIVRLHPLREQLLQLQDALVQQLEVPGEDDPIAPIDERNGLLAAQALERELVARIEAVEAKLAQAAAAAPAVKRAGALLHAGRIDEAVAQFEAIVAKLPDHRRGREGLDEALAEAEAHRRRQRCAELREKALAALEDHRYTLCLEILGQVAEIPPPDGMSDELATLRQTALTEQTARRRTRQEAEEVAQQVTQARAAAQGADAPRHAPVLWNEAQASAAAAEACSRREAYGEAKQGFDQAMATYHRAVATARKVQADERQAAERARDGATQGQQRAAAAGANQYAGEPWSAAEAKLAEAEAAFGKNAPGRGCAPFMEAAGLYRQAESLAREASERERRRAEASRERTAEGRRTAAALEAERHVPSTWHDAVAKSTAGEAALVRHQYAKAIDAFEAALALYHHAQAQVRDLARRQREETTRKREEMAEHRRLALALDAPTLAVAEWTEAEASAGTAEAAVERNAWPEAGLLFGQAAGLYQLAEDRARDALQARRDAEQAVEAAGLERRAATEAGEQATVIVDPRDTAVLAPAMTSAEPALSSLPPPGRGDTLSPATRTTTPEPDDWEVAAPGHGRALALVVGLVGLAAITIGGFFYWRPAPPNPPNSASTGSPQRGEIPRVSESRRAGNAVDAAGEAVEALGTLVTAAREEAIRAGAERLAPTHFANAAERARQGEVALGQRDLVSAERRYRQAVEGYNLAKAEADRPPELPRRQGSGNKPESAREVAARSDGAPERAAKLAEPARSAAKGRQDVKPLVARVERARRAAEQAAAGYYARQSFTSAQTREQLANAALERSDYSEALRLLGDAESAYQASVQEAQREAAAEQKVAPLKASAEQSRAGTRLQRDQALAAGADKLARDAFEAAETVHREADSLATRQNFTAAAQAYLTATARYRDAASRAQTAREPRPARDNVNAP